jgi:heme exporter protein A
MAPPRASFETVTVDRVTRVYGVTRALAGVSATFRAGEVASLEGGNGAGKSTLLAILATLSRPTAGEVRWGEYQMPDDREAIRATVGLVAHEAMVYPDLTPRESLALMAALHDLDDRGARIEASLARAGLTALGDRPARTFSRGQLQRLAVARAELHDPTLVLFDEPTTGLDARAVARLEEDIARARSRGRIVVLVTHDDAFAGRVADVRITLDRGRIASVRRSAD